MKNSAWYHRIWLKKLQELPLNKDAESSWADMKTILDKEFPALQPETGPSPQTTISKLISPVLTYILPAAAMIVIAGHFLLKSDFEKATSGKKKKQIPHSHIQKNLLNLPKHQTDTVRDTVFQDTLNKSSKKASYLSKLLSPAPNNLIASVPQDTILYSETATIDKAPFQPLSTSGISAAQVLSLSFGQFITPSTLDSRIQFQIFSVPYTCTSPNEHNNRLRWKKHKESRIASKEITTPLYNYDLEIGASLSENNNGFYLGANGYYALNKRWLVSVGLQLHSKRQLSGEYLHPSYFRPDSLPPFQIIDSRKVSSLTVPFLLEYKVSNSISLKAGPLLSLLLRQSDKQNTLGHVPDIRDTVFHTKDINKALSQTTVRPIQIGFTGGISLHLKQFDLNGKYQVLSPYKVSNDLGSYQKAYQALQIGIGYRFKR